MPIQLLCKPFRRAVLIVIVLTFLTAMIYEPSGIIRNIENETKVEIKLENEAGSGIMLAVTGMQEEYRAATSGQNHGGANDLGEIVVEVNDVMLRVMTFNIRHARGMDGKVDIDRIKEQILQSNADIIGLQEVDRYNLRSGFKDQIKELGNALGMSWAFSPSLSLGWSQYGNAILSKYPIVSSRISKLPSRIETRTVLQVEVQVGMESIQLFNTHLGVFEKDRAKQMPLLIDLLDRVKKPSILMGDFNMEIENPLMEGVHKNWNKVNVGKPTVQSGLEIDHIFFNMPGNALESWTQPSTASDHDPVVADIAWKPLFESDPMISVYNEQSLWNRMAR